MSTTNTVIIGGGQAGLAMSRCLTDLGIDHVVLERGRVAERWRSERWDSLHLLSPNWQARLPGWRYRGPDPDGFMTMPEVIDYFEGYRRSFDAPVREGVTVTGVDRTADGYRVTTDDGTWFADNVVVATGACDRPFVPPVAAGLSGTVAQVTPSAYRNPAQLADGGVLVVGASATGAQLADELARRGRHVVLATGRHARMPRRYRGADIMAWLDRIGSFDETIAEVADLQASRRQPSLQLVGGAPPRDVDLGTLHRAGVRVVGRLTGIAGTVVDLADDLAVTTERADEKMSRLLDRIDSHIVRSSAGAPDPDRPRPVELPTPPTRLDLRAEGIETVLWATGYTRSYPWLHVPVLDERGEIRHLGGLTPSPGLYVLGLRFLRRRKSNFIDGVGDDARDLAAHIDLRCRQMHRSTHSDQLRLVA